MDNSSPIPRLCRFSLLLLLLLSYCFCEDNDQSFLISTFTRPATSLKPYDWTYLRVELPPWFSSMSMVFESEADIGEGYMKKLPASRLPVICLKDGSPPVPDISGTSLDGLLPNFHINGSFGGTRDLLDAEQCIPFQKNLTVTLTNEQICPGVWYFGFFNGLGPARTQSRMISRGLSYTFRTKINVRGCGTSAVWGPYCNQTIDIISCSESSNGKNPRNLLGVNMYNHRGISNHMARGGSHLKTGNDLFRHNTVERQQVSNSSIFTTSESLITCSNSVVSSCIGYGEFKFYYLDLETIASQFEITAANVKLNQTSFVNKSSDSDGILLMCYARYNAMPLSTLHEHSADISRTSLIVKSPKIGRWYIAVQSVNQTKTSRVMQEMYSEAKICFSFQWQVHECLRGKAGVNCTWEGHMLQRVPRRGSSIPFESYYLPVDANVPLENADFPVEHLLSNFSSDDDAWTYFFVDVPHGAAAANMHVQFISDTKLNHELYSKYGGIASSSTWDYYVNSTSSSNQSTLLVSNDPSEESVDFYILYAREGIWCFGLKHPSDTQYKHKATMSITLEGCPKHCSSNGQCHNSVDGSGLTFYSYCACDRDHGGFDCSNELVSHEGHVWQSAFLITSNAAAILPAFWALRQKAFAEWVLFTSSGISSGLYHACDVGTWCVLSFHVLQFLDFWLSFMAVVSTFVYMSTIDEASKRAIHTVVAIVTALLAVTGATRSENIILVIAIGTVGLLIGWLLELSTSYRSIFCPFGFELDIHERWLSMKMWFWNLIEILRRRFHWLFILLGFVAVACAAISWKLETNESYWIWHSLWHITIYTSSFFFLCSTSLKNSNEPQPADYELTRQDSLSRRG